MKLRQPCMVAVRLKSVSAVKTILTSHVEEGSDAPRSRLSDSQDIFRHLAVTKTILILSKQTHGTIALQLTRPSIPPASSQFLRVCCHYFVLSNWCILNQG